MFRELVKRESLFATYTFALMLYDSVPDIRAPDIRASNIRAPYTTTDLTFATVL